MSYILKLHGIIVGRTELEHRDASAKLAWGAFRPGAGYELVEPVFALRSSDLARYRAAMEKLRLELVDPANVPLAASRIEIEGGPGEDELQLRATVTEPRFWASP